ncbi:craniofacial development protein 2-like, partial [Elysia marginata]
MTDKKDYKMVYSGGSEHSHGVGIVMSDDVAKSLIGYWPVSDRIIMCKFKASPFDLTIVQVYAPTSYYTHEEVEQFYECLNETLKQVKSTDIIIILGDFNAKVGNTALSSTMGRHGLGSTNERGESLINFCEQKKMTIVNALFKQPVRRLYTWKSPGDVRRNQIDYMLKSSRFKNSAINCRTYPGADIGSDHNPVIMQMTVKLQIPHSKQTKTVKYCTKLLQLPEEAEKYAVLVKNKFECLYVEEADATTDIDQQWDCLNEAIEKTNEEFLPRVNREAKQEWITEDILDMMKERKRLKR